MTVSETTPDRPQSQPVTFRTNDQQLDWAYGEYWRNRPSAPETSSVDVRKAGAPAVPVDACNGMVLAADETGQQLPVSIRHAAQLSGENEGGSTTGCTPPPSLTEPLPIQEAG